MKNFFKNKREIIAVASFLSVIVICIYLVIIPLLKRITSVKDEMESVAISQNFRREKLNELSEISRRYAEISEQQKKIDILLNKDQTISLLGKLERLAQETKSGITISILANPRQAVADNAKTAVKKEATLIDSLPSRDYLEMKISLVGDYNGLMKFVGSLENLEYYSDIIGISITHAFDVTAGSKNGADKKGNVLNPFDKQASTANSAVPASLKNGRELDMTLDVVFYSER